MKQQCFIFLDIAQSLNFDDNANNRQMRQSVL